MKRLTISRRISLTAAFAVAIAILLASLGGYLAVRTKLRDEIDSSLRQRAVTVQRVEGRPLAPRGIPRQENSPFDPPLPRAAQLGGAPGYVQIVSPDGIARRDPDADGPALPISNQTREIANGEAGAEYSDVTVSGEHLRVYAAPLDRGAVQVARPLDEVERTLRGLLILFGVIAVIGIGLAAAVGWWIARTSLAPIRRFADETESIADEHALGRRIDIETDDEIGRLATTFNSTLDELENSVNSQRLLVADASHELRTPLASIKTNIQVLQREDALTPTERGELLHDINEQIDELTLLSSDIVELARRGEQDDIFTDDVDLSEVAAAAVQRAANHWPKLDFKADLMPYTMRGVPERLDRAISNLLDNAAKWSPVGATVELTVTPEGELSVRDHGPGFSEEDLPHVFDRFYRAPAARSLPGSGLGLAIVRQVAEIHRATVVAENADGGGAILRISFS